MRVVTRRLAIAQNKERQLSFAYILPRCSARIRTYTRFQDRKYLEERKLNCFLLSDIPAPPARISTATRSFNSSTRLRDSAVARIGKVSELSHAEILFPVYNSKI